MTAALFGLRLAVRSLGYVPVTDLLPDPARLRLMARVSTGAAAPINSLERLTAAAARRQGIDPRARLSAGGTPGGHRRAPDSRDRRTDWLRAGQALYRLLRHAAISRECRSADRREQRRRSLVQLRPHHRKQRKQGRTTT